MELKVITPQKKVFEGEITSVTLPGEVGELTILPGHTFLVGKLDAGKMKIRSKEGDTLFRLGEGLVEVAKDHVTVLAQSAEAYT
ncbi:MAG: ATP synthase F1 subunit epsilon [Deltaproteobacteria bacterium CG_4_10_14_0_2_um_filter_43_8]|nr:MAG: ATP synthase F1 subunit epsilon [Deltaproteobacteria bacterium CG11_big_fil_rev_8_21_14_0_20_42_23]PJA21219.1 MAG: ATP synthase F1 subunit epsilon [Deltaproteobacteria bacterium CG_4_10_14_0_2_um_filter_43_8]PJC63501.1 MAG: ATP synthase F1 subunit epsilon [Deltaproteobacteria bacterium CG_4_9_14_0_2_um_filter_42_21]